MASLNHFLAYTVCAVAVIYLQSDFAFATSCVQCDNFNTSKSICNLDSWNETATNNHTHCTTKGDQVCVAYAFGNTSNLGVIRGCYQNCSSLANSFKNVSTFNCVSCNTEYCNTVDLHVPSSSPALGISFVSLFVSAIVTLYSR